ncbi:MAG: MurR/RpiR family transcriptional regulator [Coprobacillus sp.]
MDTMQKISIYYNALTKAERLTCDLIIEKPEIVIDNPIAEAAAFYNVSPSSILRLSKKLKYKGYSEFRYALEACTNKSNSSDDNHNSICNQVINIYQSTFDELKNQFNEEQIEKLINIIKTKNIKTIGIGNSSLPAKQLAYSLYMEDRWCENIDDSVRIGFLENHIGKDDAAIFFTVSAENDLYYSQAKKWRNSGATVVVITTNPEARLKKVSDLTIVLPAFPLTFQKSSQHVHYLENRSTFYVFIDILLAYYTANKGH